MVQSILFSTIWFGLRFFQFLFRGFRFTICFLNIKNFFLSVIDAQYFKDDEAQMLNEDTDAKLL